MKAILFTLLLTIGTLIGCTNAAEPPQVPPEHETPITTEPKDVEVLTAEEAADKVVQLLKDKDMSTLSEIVHPTKGVRFTPYGYVDIEGDQVFLREQVSELWEDETVYNWGHFDGTGDPIDLTFPEYYERFVYDVDYVNAEETSVNERLGHGNSLDNSQEVYPNGAVIEYHFSGFEEQYAGMDWRSLRLVLEEQEGRWYLVGVIHDEWTI